jgi:hypothetical protein
MADGEVLDLVLPLALALALAMAAVTGIEQTNDAERLRESLDWGGRYSYLATQPAILVTILLVLAPTSLAGSSISRDSTEYSAERTHARTHARGETVYGDTVASHPIPSHLFQRLFSTQRDPSNWCWF